jgi:hypothetical protein
LLYQKWELTEQEYEPYTYYQMQVGKDGFQPVELYIVDNNYVKISWGEFDDKVDECIVLHAGSDPLECSTCHKRVFI